MNHQTKANRHPQFSTSDQIRISHTREEVWAHLNNPSVLAECIRGCARVEKVNENRFDAVIEARIGRIKRDFKVRLEVHDALAPEQYQLASKMSVGLFGRADGVANVRLKEEVGVTVLDYQAVIHLNGLLAKAMPLIAPLAKQRVRAFFDLFEASMKDHQAI